MDPVHGTILLLESWIARAGDVFKAIGRYPGIATLLWIYWLLAVNHKIGRTFNVIFFNIAPGSTLAKWICCNVGLFQDLSPDLHTSRAIHGDIGYCVAASSREGRPGRRRRGIHFGFLPGTWRRSFNIWYRSAVSSAAERGLLSACFLMIGIAVNHG